MNIKNCDYCQKELIGKRSDAKFCSSSCKAKFFEKNKKNQVKKEVGQPKSVEASLRGVINSNNSNKKTPVKESKVVSKKYKRLEEELDVLQTSKDALIQERDQYISRIETIVKENGQLLKIAVAALGTYFGDKNFNNKENNIAGGLAGFIAGNIVDNIFFKNNRDERKSIEIKELSEKIKLIDVKLTSVKEEIKRIESRILTIEFIASDIPDNLTLAPVEKVSTPETNKLVNQNQITTSSKILNSLDLDNIDYKALNFQGKWLDFLGLPTIIFHCGIYGMPGGGKSNLAIQFAKYLADNFGKTIYISGEEGFSRTLYDKLCGNNAKSENLDIADLRSYDDIIKEINTDAYNFILIDSLDNMKISINEFKDLRKRFINSAIISISQSTKDGKMRGSNEIVHDCDINIKVDNGIATTTKNRFKKKDKEFKVFDNYNLSE